MRRNREREGRRTKPYTDLSDLANKYLDEKCFICGAGPTVAFTDLSNIHNHVVIAVNSAILLMPWDEGDIERRYWISNDTLCTQWSYFWKTVLRSHCYKIVRTSWRTHDERIRDYDFRYFAPRKDEDGSLINDGVALCSVSSVPTAIDLALLMGCKEIYLLGVDHKMIHGNSHFWQFWPQNKWPQRKDKSKNFSPEQNHQKKMFRENMPVYKALKRLATKLDVQIYNCSNNSAIELFEKISIKEAV